MNNYKAIAATLALVYLTNSAGAQIKIPSVLKQVASADNLPSEAEMVSGIKEALQTGIASGSSKLSAVDGFLNNSAVKILFPPEALKAERSLRSLGFNDLCDNVIKTFNRAAEESVKESGGVFQTALKEMSLQDAKAILLAKEKDAATQYFKSATSTQLIEKFRPVVQSHLDKTGATKYWATAISQYNKVPLTSKINTDLNAYVTQKALDGLFQQIAIEELKIRENRNDRTTAVMQKVFAYADKK